MVRAIVHGLLFGSLCLCILTVPSAFALPGASSEEGIRRTVVVDDALSGTGTAYGFNSIGACQKAKEDQKINCIAYQAHPNLDNYLNCRVTSYGIATVTGGPFLWTCTYSGGECTCDQFVADSDAYRDFVGGFSYELEM